jgi:hypothetical protein
MSGVAMAVTRVLDLLVWAGIVTGPVLALVSGVIILWKQAGNSGLAFTGRSWQPGLSRAGSSTRWLRSCNLVRKSRAAGKCPGKYRHMPGNRNIRQGK